MASWRVTSLLLALYFLSGFLALVYEVIWIRKLGLVFPNGAGNVEDLSNIHRRGFGAVQAECGITGEGGKIKYGLHALRHFYASWMINRKQDGGLELPAKKVQQRLGHSSIVMTLDVYGHLFPDTGDEFDELAAAEQALLGA